MQYVIADGSTKDIEVGDLIQCIPGIFATSSTNILLPVVAVGDPLMIQVQVTIPGSSGPQTIDLSAVAVAQSWRQQ